MSEAPDFEAVTEGQRKSWSEGDFSQVAGQINFAAERLVESLALMPGERVLDVACGSGNAALAAARRGPARTVGSDFVPALLERGRERAAAERLEVEFVEGDAQDLPFDEGEFEVTMSVFGAIVAPDQERTAAELLRVTAPGGRIGMANWSPGSRSQEMVAVIARHTGPPPAGLVPPDRWGTEERLRELFGDGISSLRTERRRARQAFPSAEHYIDLYRRFLGPFAAAFEKVGPEGEAALTADLLDFLAELNTAGGEAFVMEPEYLEVIATRA